MGIFNRRKKKEEDITSPVSVLTPTHRCIMKDLPWYLEYKFNDETHTFEYKIIEPFICVNGCCRRVDKQLEHSIFHDVSKKWREEYLDHIRAMYKDYLRPRAVVEDMINDIFLVKDPQHLQMVEKMRGLPHQGVGNSYSTIPQSDYRIKVEK